MAVIHHPVIRAKQPSTRSYSQSWNSIKRANHHSFGMVMRIPIAWTGVPFLGQPPIMPARDVWLLEFTPPDAGFLGITRHMNSVEQLGKGLVLRLIVDESKRTRLPIADSGTLYEKTGHNQKTMRSLPPWPHHKMLFRMGTPGRVMTLTDDELKCTLTLRTYPLAVPFGVRLLNVDNTLVMKNVTSTDSWMLKLFADLMATRDCSTKENSRAIILLPPWVLPPWSRCYCVQQGGETVTFKA